MTTACNHSGVHDENEDTDIEKEATFVGQQECRSCHLKEYNEWKQSDHFLAMQSASDSSVLGDFNDATFSSDGVTSKFYRKNGKFFINTQGEDGLNHDYEVVYTFGYFPLQQYLIAFPGGRLQATRVSWDSRDNKWFHQYEGQKIFHKDWLHWTGNSQNWNTMCASCHSTNLRKNYDFEKDVYQTTWKDMNVSCESCHGPGSRHIDFINSKEYKRGDRIRNSGFVYSRDTISQLQLNTCAPCHARKTDISPVSLNSDELLDNLIPQIISNEIYFPDGQIREENYEYGSFTQSKMFHNNVKCSSCHNPHSGKLLREGNNLCTSCHKPEYNTPQHHFHAVNSKGSECISCHMPVKTYMANDHRRDHSFRVPRPDQSVIYGTPDACTACHTGKTSEWAAIAINKWYGTQRAYHFSDDLAPGSLLNEKSEAHLKKLLSDTLQPEIARATAAHYLGRIHTESSAEALLSALHDAKPLVRYQTVRALQNFSPETWQLNALPVLSDKVRAVRIAAADLYHQVSKENFTAESKAAYQSADDENKKFLHYQTDFALGNVMLADYKLQDRDYVNAIRYYLRGLEKDSLMNYARFNLSAAYNSIGKNKEALETLKDAAAIDPLNERTYYNLGLLYYELGDNKQAIENFEKSEQLGSVNPGLYYNYGLLLQQQGNIQKAEKILLKGFAKAPEAGNINYALAYIYIQQKQSEKARKHVQRLYLTDPLNPEYQSLFKNFGM